MSWRNHYVSDTAYWNACISRYIDNNPDLTRGQGWADRLVGDAEDEPGYMIEDLPQSKDYRLLLYPDSEWLRLHTPPPDPPRQERPNHLNSTEGRRSTRPETTGALDFDDNLHNEGADW